MLSRFAAAPRAVRLPIGRAQNRALATAANDNVLKERDTEELLNAALRHFGAHGLGAARTARDEAASALANGDSHGYERWLGICRALDKRLAHDFAFSAYLYDHHRSDALTM
jgi:hypothetical protein